MEGVVKRSRVWLLTAALFGFGVALVENENAWWRPRAGIEVVGDYCGIVHIVVPRGMPVSDRVAFVTAAAKEVAAILARCAVASDEV